MMPQKGWHNVSTIDFINVVVVVDVVIFPSLFLLQSLVACVRPEETTMINSERKLLSVGFSFRLSSVTKA